MRADVAALVLALRALAVQEDYEGMHAILSGLTRPECEALACFLASDLARGDLQPYREPDGEVPPEARELVAARWQRACLFLQGHAR